MRFSILFLLSLFMFTTAKPINEEERQSNDPHIPWGNWIQQSGGPAAFRAELRSALREILQRELSE